CDITHMSFIILSYLSSTSLFIFVIFFPPFYFLFFFNDTATTEIYTLSLHDALPISRNGDSAAPTFSRFEGTATVASSLLISLTRDRKSTRLNSSHVAISYAVFCLKKKKTRNKVIQ